MTASGTASGSRTAASSAASTSRACSSGDATGGSVTGTEDLAPTVIQRAPRPLIAADAQTSKPNGENLASRKPQPSGSGFVVCFVIRSRVVIVVALVLAVIGGGTGAAFASVESLTSPGQEVSALFVAQFGNGSVIVVTAVRSGSARSELDVFERAPGQRFRLTRRLDSGHDVKFHGFPGGKGPAGLATNRAGAAVVAWTAAGEVRVVARRPGGEFGAVQRLGRASASYLSDGAVASMTPGGNGLVMWTGPEQHLHASMRRADADRFSPPTDLGRSQGVARVAVGARSKGFALVWEVCTRIRPGTCSREAVRASITGARGTFSAPQMLGPVDGTPARLSLQVGPLDDTLVLWSGTRRGLVRSARLARGAARFGAIRVVSNPHLRAHSVTAATGRAGGLVAWTERLPSGRVQVVGADIDARERVGVPAPLSAPVERAAVPTVQVQDDGTTVVWWRRTRGGDRQGAPDRDWSIRTRAANGPFARVVDLPGFGGAVSVNLDGHGDVLALMVAPGPSPLQCGSVLVSAAWRAGDQPRPSLLDECATYDPPVLLVDTSGRALAIWSRSPSATEHQARIATRSPRGEFASASTIAPFNSAWLTVLSDDGNALLIGIDQNRTLYATSRR
jgi:hypothetical protein